MERNPINNTMVITQNQAMPPLKDEQDKGYKKKISQLFG